jgi:hypothetical protein
MIHEYTLASSSLCAHTPSTKNMSAALAAVELQDRVEADRARRESEYGVVRGASWFPGDEAESQRSSHSNSRRPRGAASLYADPHSDTGDSGGGGGGGGGSHGPRAGRGDHRRSESALVFGASESADDMTTEYALPGEPGISSSSTEYNETDNAVATATATRRCCSERGCLWSVRCLVLLWAVFVLFTLGMFYFTLIQVLSDTAQLKHHFGISAVGSSGSSRGGGGGGGGGGKQHLV